MFKRQLLCCYGILTVVAACNPPSSEDALAFRADPVALPPLEVTVCAFADRLPCRGDGDCTCDAYCGQDAACVGRKPNGAGCNRDRQCQSDLCIAGTCEATTMGTPCVADDDCGEGRFCKSGGWCGEQRQDGASCTRDGQCTGGACRDFDDGDRGAICTRRCQVGCVVGQTCQGGYCFPLQPNDASCAYASQCQSGDCGLDTDSDLRFCAVRAGASLHGSFVNIRDTFCDGSCSEGHDDKECTCSWRGGWDADIWQQNYISCDEYRCCDDLGQASYRWVNFGSGHCTAPNETGWFLHKCRLGDQSPWAHLPHWPKVCAP